MRIKNIPGGPPSIDKNYPFHGIRDILKQNPKLKFLMSNGDIIEESIQKNKEEK